VGARWDWEEEKLVRPLAQICNEKIFATKKWQMACYYIGI